MPRKRPLGKKYNISKHRFWELYHYCLQYNEWKSALKLMGGLNSVSSDGQPKAKNIKSDPTANAAIKASELQHRCSIIEDTAMAADEELHEYILYAVTNEDVTYNYLNTIRQIPCSSKKYYEARSKFYWLLDKRI